MAATWRAVSQSLLNPLDVKADSSLSRVLLRALQLPRTPAPFQFLPIDDIIAFKSSSTFELLARDAFWGVIAAEGNFLIPKAACLHRPSAICRRCVKSTKVDHA